jgi:hypothetical protein
MGAWPIIGARRGVKARLWIAGVDEGVVGQMMGFQIAPDRPDVMSSRA